jgi:hypothetical protein
MNNDVAGAAALAICESLLLSLGEQKILPENEISGVLEDAMGAHLNAAPDDGTLNMHEEAAALIKCIIESRNSVRRPHGT